jgi:hypothetical protein
VQERNHTDRRCRAAAPRYPFRDSDGNLVRQDRRKLPDRRLDGIEVEWLEMREAAGIEK